jgi:disulfide bond formation protein DsbB
MRMPAAFDRVPWPAAAAAVSAAMLATAHGFQRIGGYDPCALCLRQREVYWGALTIALVGLALARLRRAPLWLVSLLLGAAFLAGAVVAGYHAGAEWKWWPGPSTCSGQAAGAIQASDLTAILDGATRIRPPACDVASWRMLGLSMAGWNFLVSLGLAALSFLAAGRERAPA